MDYLKDMLIRNGIIKDDGSYLTDALVRNQICVCDRHGHVTHRIESAANGVDILAVNTKTRLADLRIKVA
ncbi:hypothetical protein IJH89_01825 [Candidatus Saccharibacteria bacterium]|nr:hypothetical protein [Candidatus Saccharibacteria bacterium]